MNCILTVIGKDKVGIIAGVTSCLAKYNVNVLDLTQTIMQGNFTMVVLCDCGKCTVSFAELAEICEALGKDIGLSVKIQRTEIFDAMQSI